MQPADHLPVVRPARNPGTQSILAFDTDLGDGEGDRLLNGGENGFSVAPTGNGLAAHGVDADKCGATLPQC